MRIKHLEVILKTVERCNINCSYCYFFNGLDQSYLKHPPYISQGVIKQTVQFLKDGCLDLDIKSLRIDFHGGEPLMQKTKAFDLMCQEFYRELSSITELSFAIQTNGMLINEEWIELFHRYNVAVGVSLDGPKEYNDIYRLDKKGRSSYQKSVNGINLLHKYANQGYIMPPGVLCVINPEYSPGRIYQHFVKDLFFTNIDFLIPDITRDAAKAMKDFDATAYGKFLCKVFDDWVEDDNPNIRIRILNSFLSLFAGGDTSLQGWGRDKGEFCAFTIASNGDLGPDDTLRSCNPKFMNLGLNVAKNKLQEFLTHDVLKLITNSEQFIPTECLGCKWIEGCRGGTLINRYSAQESFIRKSAMCEGLKLIFNSIHQFLIANNIKSIIC